MNYTVGNYRGKLPVAIWQSFGVDAFQADAAGQARLFHVLPAECEHVLRHIDGQKAGVGDPAAEFDGYQGRARAQIEDFALFRLPGGGEQIGGEEPIHLAVVHGIIIQGLFKAVHGFGFKYALEHNRDEGLGIRVLGMGSLLPTLYQPRETASGFLFSIHNDPTS